MSAVEHLRREAHQLRHEADLVRFDQASDEAWLLEQQAEVLDARVAEIETRIDAADGATP